MAAAAAAATAAGKTTKSTSEQALQLAAASVQQHQSSQASHSSVSSSTSALLATSKNRSPGQLASPLSTAVLHSQQLQSQNRQEEVQQQLISQHQPSMVVLPAAAAVKATSTVQPNTYSPSSNPDTRTHVVGELYDTERSYVESLQILVEKYMKPLKSLDSNRILIDSNLVDEIFYTIPEILQHHETFLSALQDRLTSDWDTSQVIGNVFIEAFTNQQIIDTYTAFINNWKNARQAIKIATQSKPAFERYLEAMSREHRNKLTLDALLIMPVQRIPRYELLIKELIKHTPEDHPDHGPLMEAQKEIHELALKIDRAEKEMIHQEQLKDLESLIEGHVELQHPQREFIRYDLVTILGASALTVAKKERVLFLFCDLLIMTSVKKKASRRSNLQTAFANSSNDLSLLEGNKFKLLLRVSLDQVEIRQENDQILLQQQQQQQHQLQLQQQQSRLIHERKREIEGDLYILHQIDSLSSKMSLADKTKVKEAINELAGQLRQRLLSLEQNDLIQSFSGINQAQAVQDLYTIQSPTSGTGNALAMGQSATTGQLSNCPISQSAPSSQITSTSSNNLPSQQDSNLALEFIISNTTINNNPAKDPLNINLSSSSVTSDSIISNEQAVDSNTFQAQRSLNCDTLVVTFTSHERKQAFLHAFMEAKQQRYILQHHRQHQNQRTFSSSATIRLAQPNSPDKRQNTMQENADSRLAPNLLSGKQQTLLNNVTSRISSSPSGQNVLSNSSTILHQMSAPVSLALEAISASPNDDIAELTSQCLSLSSNIAPDGGNQIHHHHPHHHHQLMHQPASHPASLNMICCNDMHNDTNNQLRSINQSDQLSGSPANSNLPKDDKDGGQHYTNYYKQMEDLQKRGSQSGRNSIVVLNSDDTALNSSLPPAKSHRMQLISIISQNLLFKSAPEFLTTIPMNFLNTQHPALQFTCSTLRHIPMGSNSTCDADGSVAQLGALKRQTIKDSSGQLWLCMSNGYVSHVALIAVRKRFLKKDAAGSKDQDYCDSVQAKRCYSISPIIHSAGDICKSHINCATQVKWSREPINSKGENLKKLDLNANEAKGEVATNLNDNGPDDGEEFKKAPIEVAIKSASPPVDIKSRPDSANQNEVSRLRLSESAPSKSDNLELEKAKITNSSASTTRLEVPSASAKIISRPVQHKPMNQDQTGQESKRSLHDTICQRHYHHNHKLLQNRLSLSTPNQQQHLHTGHHHQHHHNQHLGCNRNIPADCHRTSQRYHQHSHHHHHHHHHLYTTRHNTVPIAELRKLLERQNKIQDHHCTRSSHLAPPANTPADSSTPNQQHASSPLDTAADRTPKKVRSTTPPASKSFRSARMLRHQASLKTSSILAKLVSGASKRSSYLRKSALNSDKQSDLDDNDTDTDSGNVTHHQVEGKQQEDGTSIDSNILALTTPGAAKRSFLNTSQTEMANPVISPLSSVSSLNSTNSSMTANSMCASTPNRGSCELLVHSLSASCCAAPIFKQMHQTKNPNCISSPSPTAECGIRSRSATVPNRTVCQGSFDRKDEECLIATDCAQSGDLRAPLDQVDNNNSYKVSEIISDPKDPTASSNNEVQEVSREIKSSLWLGCDDGSIIIINCLNEYLDQSSNCNICDLNQKNLNCGNLHSEIKLDAPVSDIKVFEDRTVFVALSNGQLAIFSRDLDNKENGGTSDAWSLTNPQILTVTTNELNSTSKLCLIDEQHLWYSYGRKIFVLNINTLKLETTIMAPTNDLSLQFTLQSITIDNMELMSNLFGVWISFKNSHSIQLYDFKRYKLLAEINLFEPVNKMLSFGNEIIRQHKTACLRATSLLNVNNLLDQYNTLYIGTSAGVILYLNISHKHLIKREDDDEPQISDWNPQIASLRHGHSGHVKFLHLISAEEDRLDLDHQDGEQGLDYNNNTATPDHMDEKRLFLVSGGTGVDLYGPNDDQQVTPQLNSDEDNLNHLMLWQL